MPWDVNELNDKYCITTAVRRIRMSFRVQTMDTAHSLCFDFILNFSINSLIDDNYLTRKKKNFINNLIKID